MKIKQIKIYGMPWKQCLEEHTYHSVDTLKIKFSMTSASTLRNCKINSRGNTNETRKNNWKDQSKTLIEIKSRKKRENQCKWKFIKNINKLNKLLERQIRTKRWNSQINNIKNGRERASPQIKKYRKNNKGVL